MTSDTMRDIDRLLGPPLCFLLTAMRKLGRLFGRPPRGPLREARRLLFVKPAEMGSTVLTYPALLRARQLWPDCELYFLVFHENKQAVQLLTLVPDERIFTIRSDHFLNFALDAWRVIFRLRALRFDAAIDLEFFSRAAALLTALAGARVSAGFERYTTEGLYKGDLLTHPVQYNPHIHTAASFVSLIDALVQEPLQIPLVKVPALAPERIVLPPLEISEPDRQSLRDRIREVNPAAADDGFRVILNVNSSDLMPLRRWPLDNYIALGQRLLQHPRVFIVLTGVRKEQDEAAEVVRQLGAARCVNLVGKTSLRELLVLYTICHLMITNDSGPSHFGCLTDLPTVTLFGPETPEIYGPVGPHKRALTAGLACSPCVSAYNHRRSPCTDNVCMKAISVDQVWTTCQALLQSAGGALSLSDPRG
jgi:ADP-heptose:LPS heptosyltransferase